MDWFPVISAQHAVDVFRGIARFILLSGHPALTEVSPDFHQEVCSAVSL
jgi:hypothetical protein